MSGLIKLAIIEDDRKLCAAIWECLSTLGLFQLAGIARDGEEGLKLLLEHEVDVMIIEASLPVKDGGYVLEELSRRKNVLPACIVLSNVEARQLPFAQGQTPYLGTENILVKPFSIEVLVNRLVSVCKERGWLLSPTQMLWPKSNVDPEAFVINVLHFMNIKNNLKGYDYLKTAILMCIEDRNALESITKVLYPAIAKQHQTTGAGVERAIRHAIDDALETGDVEQYLKQQGVQLHKITNSKLIKLILEHYDAEHLY